nr:MAG: DNA pilot protein [Microviridae sp.]
MAGVLDTISNALTGDVSGAITGVGNLVMNGLGLNQQVNANEQMSAYNLQNAETLWNYTNYPNQVAEIEAAGLNPALLYGKGGMGGTTMNTGMQVTPSIQPNMQAGVQAVQQQQIIDNQKPVQQSQTTDNLADAANKDADTTLKGVQTQIQNVAAQVATQTEAMQVATYKQTLQNIENLGTIQGQQIDQKNATMPTEIESMKANLQNQYTQGLLMQAQRIETNSQTGVNNQEIADSIDQILNRDMITKISEENQVTNSQNALSQYMSALVGADRLKLDQTIHNVSDKTKLTVDAVDNIIGKTIQAIGLGVGLSKGRGTPIGKINPF